MAHVVVRPFVAQDVGQTRVPAAVQIGQLGTGDRRGMDVPFKPTVMAHGRRHLIDLHALKPRAPEPKGVQSPGDLFVGPTDILIRDDMPAELARCFLLVRHGETMLDNSRRKARRRREPW